MGGTPSSATARVFRRLQFGRLAELSHARPAHLPVQAGRAGRSRRRSPTPRSTTRTARSPATGRWSGSRTRSTTTAPVEARRQPGDDRAGHVRAAARPTSSARSTTSPGSCPRTASPYNVDQWDGYTADRRELLDHLRDRGVTNTCSSPATSTRVGVRPALRRRRPTRLGESAGVEFVCTSVTSDNLNDITGDPPARRASPSRQASGANRHVKHLNFDDHGYSVLDVTRRHVQMDYFAITSDERRPPHRRNAGTSRQISFGR